MQDSWRSRQAQRKALSESRGITDRRNLEERINRMILEKMRQEGQTQRTGMTTGSQEKISSRRQSAETMRNLDRIYNEQELQKMRGQNALERIGAEWANRAKEAQAGREWKTNENLAASNRALVSDILQRGGAVTPELGNVYNMPEGFTPNWEGMAGQQLVPTAPQRPLGYSEAQRLLTDEKGQPVYKGGKPVYERYLYNKETGQPYTPSAMMQNNLNPSALPSPAMPAIPQAPATSQKTQPTKKKSYDLNQYYR